MYFFQLIAKETLNFFYYFKLNKKNLYKIKHKKLILFSYFYQLFCLGYFKIIKLKKLIK